jgi:hypothetical protein
VVTKVGKILFFDPWFSNIKVEATSKYSVIIRNLSLLMNFTGNMNKKFFFLKKTSNLLEHKCAWITRWTIQAQVASTLILENQGSKNRILPTYLSLYRSPGYSCTFVFKQIWCFFKKKELFIHIPCEVHQ